MESFETHRPRLFGIAYRMLGSVADAEDVLQDAALRWHRTATHAIRSPQAFLTTMVTRMCIDRLRSAEVGRKSYQGPWLPEPVATPEDFDPDSISTAFLLLLETLSPMERAVYLLHQVFEYGFADVGEIVGKEDATCRQIFHRAKQRIADGRPRFRASRAAHERLLSGFLQACRTGDLDALRGILAEDVVATSDGGGRVSAARKPIFGAEAVARFFIGLVRKAPANTSLEFVDLNGRTAAVVRVAGEIDSVLAIETDDDRIHAVFVIRNPDKLAHLTMARGG